MDAIVSPVPWLYQQLWQSQDQGGFGYTVSLYKSATCPCGNHPGEPPNMNCEACDGTGLLYPTAPLEALAMVSDISQDQNLMQYGQFVPGDLVLSPMPGTVHIDDFDLVILPWTIGTPTYSQVITRGSGTTDQTDYRLMNVNGAWTVDPVTGVSTEYKPNEDFTFNGRTVTWVGNTPAQGANYSIHYDAQFEWVAFNPPSPRVAFGRDLGQRAVLRKRHIVFPNAKSLLES